jgi:hypothetical protein
MTFKDHKFFERTLDNDLQDLAEFLKQKYEKIEAAEVVGVTPVASSGEHWVDSGSVSTVKWRQYNVFQFHHPGIYNIFKNISETVKEACEYYEIDFEKQQYMVQGWFNINTSKGGKLNWHDHGDGGAPNFHGYYCINAEPSITHYKIFNNPNRIVENVNKNNRMIVSEMGHPHAMGSWDWEGERITLAYDITPLKDLISENQEQHWIPLL